MLIFTDKAFEEERGEERESTKYRNSNCFKTLDLSHKPGIFSNLTDFIPSIVYLILFIFPYHVLEKESY
jgi:hypothetical protein